ncbi:DNA-binding transcriptional regulator Fis [Bacterioplanoides sp. SCSIO 12839]|uniref:DNA-binding transcriptional regulator Fis n=1 Tax=Bacterioplanoides sp. SCSIO 12839 TaxID=2829569 RepID=UPI002105091C|nr:DNA-binding transcriptional regulator Fis [Bacterioplanoides sp. SCSIO 12839]UTW47761.1 DNA-binding transcriptional regulator Fis [Bacterioplanoides sp. SCSIO 12839]
MNTEALLRKVEPVTDSSEQNNLLTPSESSQTLRDSVEKALQNYFDHLDGQPVVDIYDMVLSEVEAPLLETVMKYTRDNQTKASIVLGLNRGTLRKKLKQYGML